jgi:hypothetical protein
MQFQRFTKKAAGFVVPLVYGEGTAVSAVNVFTATCLLWSHAAGYVVGRRLRARRGPAGLFGHIGVLPHPVPITTVIGRPINVPKYEGARLAPGS